MLDPISDMLTRVRNAILVKQGTVVVPFSKMKQHIADIFKQEGFIESVQATDREVRGNKHPYLELTLKYRNGEPVVRGIHRVSKPGLKVYLGYREIPKLLPSLGVLIISTPQGLLTNRQAREKKLGGEVICEIF